MAPNAATIERTDEVRAQAAVLAGEITGTVDAEQALQAHAGMYTELDPEASIRAAHADLVDAVEASYLRPEVRGVLDLAYRGLITARRKQS